MYILILKEIGETCFIENFIIPSTDVNKTFINFISPSTSMNFFLPSLLVAISMSSTLKTFGSLSQSAFTAEYKSSLPNKKFSIFKLISMFCTLRRILLKSV